MADDCRDDPKDDLADVLWGGGKLGMDAELRPGFIVASIIASEGWGLYKQGGCRVVSWSGQKCCSEDWLIGCFLSTDIVSQVLQQKESLHH